MSVKNTGSGSGVALVLTKDLDVRGYHFVEIEGTSTNEISYVVEYKRRGQPTPVVGSGKTVFPGGAVPSTEKLPMEFDGSVGEVVLNFYQPGELSDLFITAVRIVQ